MHVYVDGGGNAAMADLERADLARYFPTGRHGYSLTVPATPGAHRVCAYAINSPAGNNRALGCRTVAVTNPVPTGQLDAVTADAASITAGGLAVDPDTADPIAMHGFIDRGARAAVANLDRPDFARYFANSTVG